MDFIPYKINEYLENVFYQIPKELFVNHYYKNLNSDSKLLYSLLLDRLSVSMKNEWIDEERNIFLIFSRYVGKINHISTSNIMSRKNYDSRNGKTTSQESEILRCNKNKYNKNNYSNIPNKRNSFCNYEQRTYEDGELDKLYCNV